MLRKKGKSHYLLIKVDATDREFLEGIKTSPPRVVKNTDNYLSQMFSISLRSVFVMQTADLLVEEGKIKEKTLDSSLEEMDDALNRYEKTIDKYFEKFADLEYGKPKKRKGKKNQGGRNRSKITKKGVRNERI